MNNYSYLPVVSRLCRLLFEKMFVSKINPFFIEVFLMHVDDISTHLALLGEDLARKLLFFSLHAASRAPFVQKTNRTQELGFADDFQLSISVASL